MEGVELEDPPVKEIEGITIIGKSRSWFNRNIWKPMKSLFTGGGRTQQLNSNSNKIITKTATVTEERNLIPKNILISVTGNTTTTQGGAGILNADIKVTNGSSTSYENQANLSVLKSNVGHSKDDVSAGVGVSLFGYYDFSVGVKLTTDVFNSELSVGISENINKDNTSTGLNVGIKPVGLLLLYGASRSGSLALPPVLQPVVN